MGDGEKTLETWTSPAGMVRGVADDRVRATAAMNVRTGRVALPARLAYSQFPITSSIIQTISLHRRHRRVADADVTCLAGGAWRVFTLPTIFYVKLARSSDGFFAQSAAECRQRRLIAGLYVSACLNNTLSASSV